MPVNETFPAYPSKGNPSRKRGLRRAVGRADVLSRRACGAFFRVCFIRDRNAALVRGLRGGVCQYGDGRSQGCAGSRDRAMPQRKVALFVKRYIGSERAEGSATWQIVITGPLSRPFRACHTPGRPADPFVCPQPMQLWPVGPCGPRHRYARAFIWPGFRIRRDRTSALRSSQVPAQRTRR